MRVVCVSAESALKVEHPEAVQLTLYSSILLQLLVLGRDHVSLNEVELRILIEGFDGGSGAVHGV